MTVPSARSLGMLLLLTPHVATLAVEKIVISGLFKDKAIVEIDGQRRMLQKDIPSPEGVILRQANSKFAVLEIDGKQKQYRLGSHIGANYAVASDARIVTIAPNAKNDYHVSGSINGFQVRFVVDTGATLVTLNKNVARRIGIPYRLEGQKRPFNTASGVDDFYVVTLKQVKVGEISLNNVQAAVSHNEFPQLVLLGNSFLSRVNMQRRGAIMRLSD